MLVNILLWALFGLIAGAAAKFIMPGKDPGGSDPMGIVITIALGIAGALLGGWLSSVLFGRDITGSFDITSFLIAVAGALLLLFLYRALKPSLGRP